MNDLEKRSQPFKQYTKPDKSIFKPSKNISVLFHTASNSSGICSYILVRSGTFLIAFSHIFDTFWCNLADFQTFFGKFRSIYNFIRHFCGAIRQCLKSSKCEKLQYYQKTISKYLGDLKKHSLLFVFIYIRASFFKSVLNILVFEARAFLFFLGF